MMIWDAIHGAIKRVLVGHAKPVVQCFMLQDVEEGTLVCVCERERECVCVCMCRYVYPV
jgi:hypothetical protein